jgi:hypothetical protein
VALPHCHIAYFHLITGRESKMDLGVAMVRAIIQKFAYFVNSKLGHSAGDLHFLPVGVPAAS